MKKALVLLILVGSLAMAEKSGKTEYGVEVGDCTAGIGWGGPYIEWEVDFYCRDVAATSAQPHNLQTAVLAPAGWAQPVVTATTRDGQPLIMNGVPVDFVPSSQAWSEVNAAFPAPQGKMWFAYESAQMIPGTEGLGEALFTIGYRWDNLPEGTSDTGAAWLSSNADVLNGDEIVDGYIDLNDPLASRLAFPWISNSDNFRSTLIANNTSDREAEITLTATRRDGEQEIVTRVVAAHGFLAETAATLFPSLGNGNGYSVVLDSRTPGFHGKWHTTRTTGLVDMGSAQGEAIDLNSFFSTTGFRVGDRLMYGYLPLNHALTSVPVVLNVSDQSAEITFSFLNERGDLIETNADEIVVIEPFQPLTINLASMIPNDSATCMVAKSTTGAIVGMSFIFQRNGDFSSGEAIRLRD